MKLRVKGRLFAAGKLPKVALVACMRKLLTTLNAMFRTNKSLGQLASRRLTRQTVAVARVQHRNANGRGAGIVWGQNW